MVHSPKPDATIVEKLSRLDFCKMRFATDRLSVGDLRRSRPKSFSSNSNEVLQSDPAIEELIIVMSLERELAKIAFCQAANISDKDGKVKTSDRGEVVRLIFEDYARLGVTSGKIETKEWIRSIEGQAREQALAGISKD